MGANEKKTYFLKQGDPLKDLKVKKILSDRVIFETSAGDAELLWQLEI